MSTKSTQAGYRDVKTESLPKRARRDPGGLDFEALRKEGIRLAQQLSGDIWTDYNLHDPGVTLLEQLCYGLTDLAYRSDFDVADYLTDAGNGKIDYPRLALHRPDEVFSTRPITQDDYRKLILGSVPNVDNVWVMRKSPDDRAPDGLYTICVQLNDRLGIHGSAELKEAHVTVIRALYAANRNLCEDLSEVRIAEHIPFSLVGAIEIDGARPPSKILADIYFTCSGYLSPQAIARPYREMFEDGMEMEALFNGPVTAHGYISDDDLHPWRGSFSIGELTGLISRIDGVKNITRLSFVDNEGAHSDHIKLDQEQFLQAVACLQFPPRGTNDALELYRAGKRCPIVPSDVETEFNRFRYKQQAGRPLRQYVDWVETKLPTGRYRAPQEYYSIQNQLPDIYGLNAYGVPESAPTERKAQAAQLKAYLLIFEQFMANFLQGIAAVPSLFSTDEELRHTYFTQALSDEAVPNIEELYEGGIESVRSRLAEIVEAHDDFPDRRNRVLDYLLALHGEQFTQRTLQQLHPDETSSEAWKIGNKLEFLREIIGLGRNRGAGFNYRPTTHDPRNQSGLIKRLRILLGLHENGKPAGTADGSEESQHLPLQLIEHILLRPIEQSKHPGHDVGSDFYSCTVSIVVPACAGPMSRPEFRQLVEETVRLNCPAHIRANLLWVDAGAQERFDRLYENWLAAKQAKHTPAAAVDFAAGELIVFLTRQGTRGDG